MMKLLTLKRSRRTKSKLSSSKNSDNALAPDPSLEGLQATAYNTVDSADHVTDAGGSSGLYAEPSVIESNAPPLQHVTDYDATPASSVETPITHDSPVSPAGPSHRTASGTASPAKVIVPIAPLNVSANKKRPRSPSPDQQTPSSAFLRRPLKRNKMAKDVLGRKDGDDIALQRMNRRHKGRKTISLRLSNPAAVATLSPAEEAFQKRPLANGMMLLGRNSSLIQCEYSTQIGNTLNRKLALGDFPSFSPSLPHKESPDVYNHDMHYPVEGVFGDTQEESPHLSPTESPKVSECRTNLCPDEAALLPSDLGLSSYFAPPHSLQAGTSTNNLIDSPVAGNTLPSLDPEPAQAGSYVVRGSAVGPKENDRTPQSSSSHESMRTAGRSPNIGLSDLNGPSVSQEVAAASVREASSLHPPCDFSEAEQDDQIDSIGQIKPLREGSAASIGTVYSEWKGSFMHTTDDTARFSISHESSENPLHREASTASTSTTYSEWKGNLSRTSSSRTSSALDEGWEPFRSIRLEYSDRDSDNDFSMTQGTYLDAGTTEDASSSQASGDHTSEDAQTMDSRFEGDIAGDDSLNGSDIFEAWEDFVDAERMDVDPVSLLCPGGDRSWSRESVDFEDGYVGEDDEERIDIEDSATRSEEEIDMENLAGSSDDEDNRNPECLSFEDTILVSYFFNDMDANSRVP